MAIDANIAQGQAPQNPLQFAQGMTSLKGQQLQQNMLQQQMGANQATSQAMQQAYDPATGKIDMNKLTGLMSQDPRAAYNLLPTQNSILENQQKQLGLDTGNFNLQKERNNFFVQQLSGLVGKDNATPKDINDIAVGALKYMPADQVVGLLKTAPSDPGEIKGWAQQHLQQAMINANQFAGVLPQNSQVGTGNATHFVSTDPITGRPTDMGQMQQNMAPGDANTPIQVFNKQTGQMEYQTKQNLSNQINGQVQQQQPSTLGLPGTGSNGRYPQQGMPDAQQAGGVAAGPALGSSAAADVMGAGNAKSVLDLQEQASGSPQRVMFLQNMAQDLDHFNSGPAANWTAQAKALALQLNPGMAQAAGVDPESVSSKEQFTKYAAQLAMNNMKGLGGGTDAQLATTVSGNPHAELSNLGLKDIITVLTGTERAMQAKNMAFQQSGKPAQQYGSWEAQWNKQIDPRVFVAPEMSQADRAKMYSGLKPADQQRFMNSYRTAVQNGIIQRPTQE